MCDTDDVDIMCMFIDPFLCSYSWYFPSCFYIHIKATFIVENDIFSFGLIDLSGRHQPTRIIFTLRADLLFFLQIIAASKEISTIVDCSDFDEIQQQ